MKTDFRTAKTGADFSLVGVTVSVENHNGSPNSVTVVDSTGKALKILSTYGISVLVPKEPEKETKHVVSGKIVGVPVREVFDDSYAALERERELQRAGGEVATVSEEMEIPF